MEYVTPKFQKLKQQHQKQNKYKNESQQEKRSKSTWDKKQPDIREVAQQETKTAVE